MKKQRKLIGQYDTLEEVTEAAYIESSDEPAPDKYVYMCWHIEKVTIH